MSKLEEIRGLVERHCGDTKEAIKEAILEGEIANEYDEAYEFMLKKATKLGLKKLD